MRRGVRNGLVAGWAVLAAGGWGLTQWLGEPVATDGATPGTARTTVPGGEPGPQPENGCDNDDATVSFGASPFPTATAVPDIGVARVSVCARFEGRTPAGPSGD
ncbi:hypothetical protein ACFVRD_31710 [Streptomyces sp. NPDC057908]|uniref:hypothetical protein n=1 Tax=Streptomyces sp. NPDC057908 TaxID=3346276 RepID=UPI0036EF7410